METDIEVCVQGLISPFLVPPPLPPLSGYVQKGPFLFVCAPVD
jgi:hypothetical protein